MRRLCGQWDKRAALVGTGSVSHNMAGEQGTAKKGDMSLLWKEFPQFQGIEFRLDHSTKRGSVHDMISTVIGKAAMYEAWSQLKKSGNPEVRDILSQTEDIAINGRGKITPVAPFVVLLEIMYLLPGKRAHQFRRQSAHYIARLLSGDLSLIDEIEARYDNSTPDEREFFRNSTDEGPDRKRRREELEDERKLRLRRDEIEIQRLELENGRMRVENRTREIESIKLYQELLRDFGLDRDPRMQMLVNDAVSNVLMPTRLAIEGPDVEQHMTVGKFMLDHGVKNKSASVVGRQMSKKYQEQFGKDPEVTRMMVNGDFRAVKVYPMEFLRQHIL